MENEKTVLELERKFLLKYLPNVNFSDRYKIEQYYSKQKDRDTYRVRKETYSDHVEYWKVKKVFLDDIFKNGNMEVSERITEEEFEYTIIDAIKHIEKWRYIYYDGKYKWEIDDFTNIRLIMAEIEVIGDHPQNYKIKEQELLSIKTPKFISDVLIKEVSGDKSFSNYFLAIPYNNVVEIK
jgi:CYTH domain-containing protein